MAGPAGVQEQRRTSVTQVMQLLYGVSENPKGGSSQNFRVQDSRHTLQSACQVPQKAPAGTWLGFAQDLSRGTGARLFTVLVVPPHEHGDPSMDPSVHQVAQPPSSSQPHIFHLLPEAAQSGTFTPGHPLADECWCVGRLVTFICTLKSSPFMNSPCLMNHRPASQSPGVTNTLHSDFTYLPSVHLKDTNTTSSSTPKAFRAQEGEDRSQDGGPPGRPGAGGSSKAHMSFLGDPIKSSF